MRIARLDRRTLPTIRHLAAVAAGGAIGGALRYALTVAYGAEVGGFPWAVLAAGVLGSFTTFSNLAFDVVMLQRVGTVALAAAYPVASMVLGLTAAAAGIAVGTAVTGRRAAEMS